MKRALQAILIAGEEAMHGVINGTKKITIRKGYRDYTKGPVMIGCHLLNWVKMFEITDVKHTTLEYISPDDLKADGFKDSLEALTELRKYYPNLERNSRITIIRWK